ncbi:hypothetical protein [Lyngbya sp. CCY1209]|jgi:hypothetical protein|uniref:hypothetical protein n=1 Tax=Lyngbya sp. CCY1209 TaxID=2886103 RepID=UPI002D203714|nr:hypothetical protein [Lyngbya sp. CCY1209]MEB3883114.1 hypothetical protein [Lyngbya sp. CCY1209]
MFSIPAIPSPPPAIAFDISRAIACPPAFRDGQTEDLDFSHLKGAGNGAGRFCLMKLILMVI